VVWKVRGFYRTVSRFEGVLSGTVTKPTSPTTPPASCGLIQTKVVLT